MTEKPCQRRQFFGRALKLMGLAGGGGFLYTLFKYASAGDLSPGLAPGAGPLGPGPENGQGGTADLGQAGATAIEVSQDLDPGQSKIVVVGYTPVIIVRDPSGFRAFIAACTHLSCLVKWDPMKERFLCPCHGGEYDAAGRVLAGPLPMGLVKCEVVVKGDRLRVSLR